MSVHPFVPAPNVIQKDRIRVSKWRVSVAVQCLACSTPLEPVILLLTSEVPDVPCPKCGHEVSLGGITWDREHPVASIRVAVTPPAAEVIQS